MLIKNANIITWNENNDILCNHALYIQGSIITDIGISKELEEKYPNEKEIVDLHGKYIMPGNICAHTHFYSAFSRGMAVGGETPQTFMEILEQLWWPLDKSLDLDGVRSSAEVSIIEAIKYGTTTLIDHHASQNAIEGSLHIIADVVEKSGVRAALCYEVTDRDGIEKAKLGVKENLSFINSVHNRKNGDNQIAALFGLHASMTLSEKTLELCKKTAEDSIGFHIHLAEAEADQRDSIQKYGMRVTERLYKHAVLGKKTIAVHGVHLNKKEMDLLAETKTWVTHQPRSNMNNAVGLPEVERMLEKGIPVCLGNDGFSNAMWEEWKTAYLSHKLIKKSPAAMNGNIIVDMAIKNNRNLVNQLFNNLRVGEISIGETADLIMVDYHPHTQLTGGNLPWHILFGFNEKMVKSTMVNGKFLMKDCELITLDEEKIMCEALKISTATWKRYQQKFEMTN